MASYICSICGEEVSKRKSLAYKGGRACKTHSEVVEASQERLTAEQEQREREVERERRKHEHTHKPFDFEAAQHKAQKNNEWLEKHCWRCGREGLSSREFAMRMLIGLEKRDLQGDHELFNTERQRKAAGLEGKVFLALFRDVPHDNKVYEYLKHRARMHADFLGAMMLCDSCAKRNGLDFEAAFHPKPVQTENIVKLMATMGAVYETSGMKDSVRAIAQAELEEESKDE
jgi:hypothetical protein